ncbi:MAG TPA: hypothetical protein VGD19_11345 [Allosphingosinicella sp.]|jgi:hypothetical protein
MRNSLLAAAAIAAAALAAPAAAQESSYTPGVYWDVGMIDIEDGRGEAYADWLASEWKRNQEFAKSKRWIRDYFVLGNAYPREGEPDLYLVTVTDRLPDAAEDLKRQREYEAWAKKNVRQMDVEQGARGSMRKVLGAMLLREYKLK